MKILAGKELEEAKQYLYMTMQVAEFSKCLRTKSGSLIVNGGMVIGKGFNSPPLNLSIESCLKDALPLDFDSDATCCVHAEQRAIMDALRAHPEKIKGSRLYYVRLDTKNNLLFAESPYCTICSKLALDAGIGEFVLWHSKGICVYDTVEYNALSFQR